MLTSSVVITKLVTQYGNRSNEVEGVKLSDFLHSFNMDNVVISGLNAFIHILETKVEDAKVRSGISKEIGNHGIVYNRC